MIRELTQRIFRPSFPEQADYGNIVPTYSQPIELPESPETAAARSLPHSTLQMLENESIRKHKNLAFSLGVGIVHTYLNRLPVECQEMISSIRIEPRKKMGGLFSGGFFSRSEGMEITFKRYGINF